jgi:oligopeptidase B
MPFEPLGPRNSPLDQAQEPPIISPVAAQSLPARPKPEPPIALAEETVLVEHGLPRAVPYLWMRKEENSERLREYRANENAYADQMLAPLAGLKEQLFREFRARLPKVETSVPVRDGNYYYYERRQDDWDYRVFYRRGIETDAPEQILLDENELAKGHEFYQIDSISSSPDGRFLAYAFDVRGDNHFTVKVKDLHTDQLLDDEISDAYQMSWTNDGRYLIYTKVDDSNRTFELRSHPLGASTDTDTTIFNEPDPAFHLGIYTSRDHHYSILSSSTHESAEFYLIDLDRPQSSPKLILPRQAQVLHDIDCCNGRIFVRSNENALNFKVMVANDMPGQEPKYTEFVAHDPDVYIEDILAFDQHLVVIARESGKRHLELIDLVKGSSKRVEFEGASFTLEVKPEENRERAPKAIVAHYGSFIVADTVIDIDLQSGVATPRVEINSPQGSIANELYSSEVISASSADGTLVPITISYRNDLRRSDQPNPVFLMGYGSYADSYDPYPEYRKFALSLMDRGILVGIAHVRGGAELGRQWFEDGKLLKHMNTFTDYIACSEHLIAQGITSPDRLVAFGRSAGGLLMGAVANMRPELFNTIFTQVPFVDVVNTMSDMDVPLSPLEKDLIGDPDILEQYLYMRLYSPTDNVRRQDYPHMYVEAGLNDPAVSPAEPAVLVAGIRAAKTNGTDLIFRTHSNEGHRGASARLEYLGEIAEAYAFVLDKLGLAKSVAEA